MEEVVVSVELTTHDDAVHGVVALIFTAVRAVGVSCFYSSHWRSATHGPFVRSSRKRVEQVGGWGAPVVV